MRRRVAAIAAVCLATQPAATFEVGTHALLTYKAAGTLTPAATYPNDGRLTTVSRQTAIR